MKKTFEDCAKCKYISTCDAHITDGTHKHREGTDSCQIDIKSRKKRRSNPNKRTIKKSK
jgi:hypothetical protein